MKEKTKNRIASNGFNKNNFSDGVARNGCYASLYLIA